MNRLAEFEIHAIDSTGQPKNTGGDTFFVAIRGASRCRARVTDCNNGKYTIQWTPTVSGDYTIAVSLFGLSLPGSPFEARVFDPAPHAAMCEASGEALRLVTARSTHCFDMYFRDRSGNVAQAVELDVFVDPPPSDPEAAEIYHNIWLAASHAAPRLSSPVSPAGQNAAHAFGADRAMGSSSAWEDGSAEELSADDEGAFESHHEEASLTRKRAIRIQVGRRPLLVRAEPALESRQIGQLQPGQTATVVEERITEGTVRARVTFEELVAAEVSIGSSFGRSRVSVSPSDELAKSVEQPSSPTSRAISGHSRTLTGWVTLKKNGKKLVSSRLKLDTTARKKYQEQFSRRQLNDKLHRNVAGEIDPTVDPDGNGIAFAFGGVHPGFIHAKGKLVEKHSVSFSVGRVGRYLLHVRLRQQAAGIPGSPFALEVVPGPASPQTSSLVVDQRPLRGGVGLGSDNGCSLVVCTHDLMGNECTTGGADVNTESHVEEIMCACKDNQDGSYLLQWRSEVSGTFNVKVAIGKEPLLGSPISIKFTSGMPEVAKCEVLGDGLKSAIAGQPAMFCICFIDTYGNKASPSTMAVGVGLAVDKSKLSDVKAIPFLAEWGPEDSGEYKLTYTATTAGMNELHIWCDPESKDERIALPGSPFTLHVIAGTPSAQNSSVNGWSRESRQATEKQGGSKNKLNAGADPAVERIMAGDIVSVKPSCCDQYDNQATLIEGMLIATLLRPDSTKIALNLLTTTIRSTQQPQYEVKADTSLTGEYEIHLELNGAPIIGSPVTFEVHESAPDPHWSKLILPADHDMLIPNLEKPATIMLMTCDRFGNKCTLGGLAPQCHISLVKQSSLDSAILMANNHSVAVEDLHNGSYAVKIAVKMACTVKILVNMDKYIPLNGGELPTMQITFVDEQTVPEETGNVDEHYEEELNSHSLSNGLAEASTVEPLMGSESALLLSHGTHEADNVSTGESGTSYPLPVDADVRHAIPVQ